MSNDHLYSTYWRRAQDGESVIETGEPQGGVFHCRKSNAINGLVLYQWFDAFQAPASDEYVCAGKSTPRQSYHEWATVPQGTAWGLRQLLLGEGVGAEVGTKLSPVLTSQHLV
jgi:hypothetical protein